jgi:MbtH protein
VALAERIVERRTARDHRERDSHVHAPPPDSARRMRAPSTREAPIDRARRSPKSSILPVMPPVDDEADTRTYTVVMNDEEQYSIWPADRELPLGWRAAGKSGLKAECLSYIEQVWTDMRPLSLRTKMAEQAAGAAGDKEPPPS